MNNLYKCIKKKLNTTNVPGNLLICALHTKLNSIFACSLSPKVKNIPKGDWFCGNCSAGAKGKASKEKTKPPTKKSKMNAQTACSSRGGRAVAVAAAAAESKAQAAAASSKRGREDPGFKSEPITKEMGGAKKNSGGGKKKLGKKQDAAAAQRDEVKLSLAAAEEEAEAVLESGKTITSVHVERALRAMKGAWPTQCRPNVAPDLSNNGFVPGMCLGLAPDRSYAGCAIGKISKQCPSLTMLVTGWVKATLKDDNFKFGAVQINYNYIAKKHIDMNNLGPSYICR